MKSILEVDITGRGDWVEQASGDPKELNRIAAQIRRREGMETRIVPERLFGGTVIDQTDKAWAVAFYILLAAAAFALGVLSIATKG